MTNLDKNELIVFIKEIVVTAGDLLNKKQAEDFTTTIKNNNPKDIVTSLDIELNDFITTKIKEKFPEHNIFSEEMPIIKPGQSDYTWTIDPIDGTKNFAHGIPHYGIVLGLLKNNIPLAGAVYNPVTRELFHFYKGDGAYFNDRSIKVSTTTDLKKAFVLLHAGHRVEVADWGGTSYTKLFKNAYVTRNFGSSGLDMAFVAASRIEAAIFGTLTTMDIAPIIGLLQEAGGIITDSSGSNVTASNEPQRIYIANNRKILQQLLDLLES